MKFADIKISCHSCTLSQLCLPCGLNESELFALDSAIEHKYKCDRNAYLFRNGDPSQAVYAVRSGSFKAIAATAKGSEQVVGFYFPGELLGLDAFANHRHNCHVIALESSVVCTLPLHDLKVMCGQLSGLQKQLMHLVGREIIRGNRLLLALGQMTAEERLAAFLISLSKRFHDRGFSATQFNLSMPRHDLANHLGIAAETVSRLLARMQKDALLSVERRSVEILDMNRLSILAHERCVPINIQERFLKN